jgi:D-galactarolactone cycloisomerase
MTRRRDFLRRALMGAAGLVVAPPLRRQLRAAGTSIPKIRVTGVTVHRIRERTTQQLGWCCRPVGPFAPGATLVEVKTDAGLTGWGDGGAAEQLLAGNPKLVIGRSPFEVEAIFDEVRSLGSTVFAPAGMPFGQPVPQYAGGAAGGLDVALWDIVGQAVGQPVCRLIGKQYRKRVMPYASAGYRKDWPDLAEGFAAELRHWTREVGFRAAKMKTGYDPQTDAEIVAAVRKAIGPEIRLGIDSGTTGVYDDGTAIALGRKLEEYNLEFWEEPIDKFDLEGYRRLKKVLRIPLASGEALPMDWVIKNYIQEELVDIVQPDIDSVGLTGGKRITHLCWLFNVRLVPHSWGSPIRIVSEMHWMAAVPPASNALNPPPALFELHLPHESPAWGLTKKRVQVDKVDGCIEVPEGPGLGIEVDRNVLEKFRIGRVDIA